MNLLFLTQISFFIRQKATKFASGITSKTYKDGDNIKMDLKEIKYDYINLIHLLMGRAQWWAIVKYVFN
jgi:hypothetical protein